MEWLGQVPEHWELKRLKHIAHAYPSNVDKKSYEGESPVRLCNYTDVYYNETIDGSLNFMEATASEDQIEKFTLRKGDTIITKDSETADDIAIATHVPEDLPGVICGYHLTLVRPESSSSGAFIKRLFDSTYARQALGVRANGLTRVGLGQYALDNVEFPLPPLSEQTAIADFLDQETAKIDGLITEQERLIELLKEKRQAVISHAVTKGLNPDVPMKDSGIEWLEKVPEHWDIRPVKYMAKIGNGSTPSREIPEYWCESGFPWLNSSVVNLPEVTEAEGFVTERALRECHLPIVVPPAVLVGITGQGRTRGMASMLRIEATLNQHLAYVTPKTGKMNVDFLLRVFEMSYLKLRRDSEEAGATKGAITCEQIGNLRIPVPPISEQRDVVVYLDEVTAKLDTLTTEAQKAIILLQERRSALISAAVTGQIDVRGIHQQQEAA